MSFSEVPDHPVIRNMERTGYPYGKEPEYPHCPICGAECDTIYIRNEDYEVIGCSECLSSRDAWEVEECFPGKEQE